MHNYCVEACLSPCIDLFNLQTNPYVLVLKPCEVSMHTSSNNLPYKNALLIFNYGRL